jgi:hypothetical protein
MRIALVGCGFLGSLWFEEVAKRVYALEREDMEFLFLDRDTFEPRNAANQNFRPFWLAGPTSKLHEPPKAAYLADIAREYGLSGDWKKANIIDGAALLEGADLIVDALDNLPARHAVWQQAMAQGTPVLHMGINGQGSGEVEWTWATEQGWHLSPIRLGAQTIKLEDQPKQPPCHLVQMRGLGLNLALAAAVATTLFMGEDIEEFFDEGPQLPGYAVLTYWHATRDSHRMDTEKCHVKKEGQKLPEEGEQEAAVESQGADDD